MPEPTPGPVHDPARLGRIAWDAQNRYELTYGAGYGQQTPWDELEAYVTDGLSDVATAVRDAVVPSGWLVVPAAAHNALMAALADAESATELFSPVQWAFDRYRAELGEEGT